jgi:hypothetical protein
MAEGSAKMVLTVKEYLTGAVGNVPVSDSTMKMCLFKADALTYETVKTDEETGEEVRTTENTQFDTDVELLSKRQQDLTLAWLYATVAGYTSQAQNVSDKSADWEHSEGSYRMSASVLKDYLAKANKIFEEYGLETISTNRWKMFGHGFPYPPVKK